MTMIRNKIRKRRQELNMSRVQLAEAVQHIEGQYTAVEIAAPDVADAEVQRKTLPGCAQRQGGTDGRQRPSRRQVRQCTAKGRQQGCRPILWSVHGSASLLSGLSYHSSGRTRKYFAFCRTKCCPTN